MKRTLIAVWAIVFLVLTNLVTLYFLTRKNGGTGTMQLVTHNVKGAQNQPLKFHMPLDDSSAFADVMAFRDNEDMNSLGVLYDAGDIRKYLDSTIYKVEARMIAGTTTDVSNYHWKVGFYWMIKPGNDGSPALDFCVLPTLIDKSDSTKVADFFKDNGNVYKHPKTNDLVPRMTTETICDTCNAFDEGQLWP